MKKRVSFASYANFNSAIIELKRLEKETGLKLCIIYVESLCVYRIITLKKVSSANRKKLRLKEYDFWAYID